MTNQKEITYYLLVNVNKDNAINVGIVECDTHEEDEGLGFYYDKLNCQTIEFVSLSEDIDIIADEEALLVSDNPIFHIKSNYILEPIQISGSFLIGKRLKLEDFEYSIRGFDSYEKVAQFLANSDVEISIVGRTS